MPHWLPGAEAMVRPHLVPRCVDGKYWMLYHIYFEQLLDDYGWFQSRREAEARIAEILRVTRPARFVPLTPGLDALN
jgi:hypothetical protein